METTQGDVKVQETNTFSHLWLAVLTCSEKEWFLAQQNLNVDVFDVVRGYLVKNWIDVYKSCMRIEYWDELLNKMELNGVTFSISCVIGETPETESLMPTSSAEFHAAMDMVFCVFHDTFFCFPTTWFMVGSLNNGLLFYLYGTCCGTGGFDCSGRVHVVVCKNIASLWNKALKHSQRETFMAQQYLNPIVFEIVFRLH